MAVVTVQTENGPVLCDEENIEAWSGKPASEFTIVTDEPAPKPKRGKKPVDRDEPVNEPDAPVAANVAKLDDGTGFILVDEQNQPIGETVYETEEAAWEAALGA
jgi:hypothetical protein